MCGWLRKVRSCAKSIVRGTLGLWSGGLKLLRAVKRARPLFSMCGAYCRRRVPFGELQPGHQNGAVTARTPRSHAGAASEGATPQARQQCLCVDAVREEGLHLPPYLKMRQHRGRNTLLPAGAAWRVAGGVMLAHLSLGIFEWAQGTEVPRDDTPTNTDEDRPQGIPGNGDKATPHHPSDESTSPRAGQRAAPLRQGNTITRDAREALEQTENLALYMRHHQILPAHFFMVLLEIQGPYSVATCIKGSGGNVYALKKKLSDVLVKLPITTEVYVTDELEASAQLRQVALRALAIAQKDGHASVGVEHLILALLEIPQIKKLLQEIGTDVESFLENVTTLYEKKLKEDLAGAREKKKRPDAGQQGGDLSHESIQQFGVDLTELAEQGQISPVFGRNKEIREVVTVLSRKGKGNPCLVGDPGVGKTAVAEGLALRIIEGMTPRPLRNKRLFSVDLGALVAGASHRGEFEARFKKLLNYALESKGRVILFIDEIHMLLGAGKSEGTMDAANLLKPAMARGEVRVLGATTHEEYKIIQKDAALERRFKPILVEEPPTSQAIFILQRLRPSFEKHHEMLISDDAITAAVLLSDKYIKHRRLPDKAIDLVDEACAAKRASVDISEGTGEREVPKRPTSAVKEPQGNSRVREGRDHQHPEGTEEELRKVEKELREEAEHDSSALTLTATDVATIISSWTGVPAGALSGDEKTTILRLREILQEKIIGQHDASRAVADAIMRSRAGLSEDNAPIGSFLFLGPPGVGKTELARVLAAEVFHSEKKLVRIDMAEFNEKNSVSKLIGTSPGYVGFEVGGKLTDAVKKRPYSVVLFDEIEKGDPSVLDILLQVLDGGRLTDGKGMEVDFTNTVVILTSNVGAQYIVAEYSKGRHGRKVLGHFDPAKESLEIFAEAAGALPQQNMPNEAPDQKERPTRNPVEAPWKKKVKKKILDEMAASGLLRREIADRLSGVLFEPISPENVKKIIQIQIKRLTDKLQARNVEFAIGDSAADLIIRKAYSVSTGVRPLKNFIDIYIKSPISRLLFSEWIVPGMRVLVTASKKFKNSFETHACLLVNGTCALRTRKARILSTVTEVEDAPVASDA